MIGAKGNLHWAILVVVISFFCVVPVYAQGNSLCDDDDLLPYNHMTIDTISDEEPFQTICFEGKEGDELIIWLTAMEGNLDPFLYIADEFYENVLTYNDNSSDTSSDASIDFTVPESATYVIFATRAGLKEGTTSGAFQLSIIHGATAAENPATSVDKLFERISTIPDLLSDGKYDEAVFIYEEAISVYKPFGGGYRKIVAEFQLKIAQIYAQTGQYGSALYYGLQALDTSDDESSLVESEIHSLVFLGNLYLRLNDYPKGYQYHKTALSKLTEDSDVSIRILILHDLGAVAYNLGEMDEAIDYLEQSRELSVKHEDYDGAADAYRDLGAIYARQLDYIKAIEYLAQSLEYEEKVNSTYGRASTLVAFGDILYQAALLSSFVNIDEETALTYFGRAYEYFSEAIKISQRAGYREIEVQGLNSRALMLETADIDAAIADYLSATDAVESTLENTGLDLSITSITGQQEYQRPFQRLAGLMIKLDELEKAVEYLERGRAFLTRVHIMSGQIGVNTTEQNVDTDAIWAELNRREALRDAMNNLVEIERTENATDEQKRQAEKDLLKARTDYEEYLRNTQSDAGYLRREIRGTQSSIDTIQAQLPEDTVLIFYADGEYGKEKPFFSDRFTVVFVVSEDDVNVHYPEMDNAEDLLKTFTSDRTNSSSLKQLYEILFAPIADSIPVGTKRIIISPDGKLNYLPFAALQNPQTGRFLIDDYAISMIPSGTTLTLLNERTTAPSTKSILALAQSKATGFQQLLRANSEAVEIAALFDEDAITNATESDLRSKIAGSGILHISAHAMLDKFNPFSSAIYFGADESDQHDGILEVREIYELDLSATELVILSGCETGSGGNGEDFGILNRAFFAAGAQKVVSSLWSVDDTATALLLTTFMQQRGKFDNDADALREAMIQTRKQYPEPYYWASFVLNGIP